MVLPIGVLEQSRCFFILLRTQLDPSYLEVQKPEATPNPKGRDLPTPKTLHTKADRTLFFFNFEAI